MEMRVRISDWANPRTVYTKNGKLFLQVAAGHIDCSICQSRVSFVSGALHRKAIKHDVIVNSERTVVDVGLPMPPEGESVEQYLEDALGLTVRSM